MTDMKINWKKILNKKYLKKAEKRINNGLDACALGCRGDSLFFIKLKQGHDSHGSSCIDAVLIYETINGKGILYQEKVSSFGVSLPNTGDICTISRDAIEYLKLRALSEMFYFESEDYMFASGYISIRWKSDLMK